MYNYSTINNWFNITGLRPHTNYYIAVSYSVNNTVGNLVLSDGSDIVEITTQCEFNMFVPLCISLFPPLSLSLTHSLTHVQHTCTQIENPIN